MKRSSFNVMMRLVKLIRPLTGFMALAVFAGVLGHLAATMIPVFAGFAVNDILGYGVPFSMKVSIVCMILFGVFRGLLKYGEQACNHYIAFRLLAIIRDHVFKALRRLSPAKLEGKDKGDLIALITSDVELLEVFYAHTISPICIAVIFSVIMCLFIGHYNWTCALLAFVSYCAVGIALPVMTSMLSHDTGAWIRRKSADLSTTVLDSMHGVLETIQYGTKDAQVEKMNDMTDSLLESQQVQNTSAGRNLGVLNILIYCLDFVMFAACWWMYGYGALKFSEVLIVVLTFISSFGPVSALAALGTTLQNTLAAGDRILDILDEEPVVEDVSGKDPAVFDTVHVDHVSFGYDGHLVLKDDSLTVEKGKITGLMGPSGSGKSTLLKLMMRFWKVDEGRIRIKERDINEMNTSDLRKMESYMTQDTVMFKDTIRNNLLIAKSDATDEELEEACRKASIHSFICSLPDGYDTQVGEMGNTLSGGEKQRIALARVFLHDSELLLLDEPTSNVDSLNEAVILKALKEEAKGKTVVITSHRPSTLQIADVVYNADQGMIS